MTATFMKAKDVAKVMRISESAAYKVIRTMNQELQKEGYLTVKGRVNTRYFMKKVGCNYNEQGETDGSI